MDLGVCVTYIFVHIHIYVHIYISMHMIIIIKESKAITLKWDMRVAWGRVSRKVWREEGR